MDYHSLDISVKPIPRHSPIPPNAVQYVEGVYNPQQPALVFLSKNQQDLIIQGPPIRDVPGIEDMDSDEWETIKEKLVDDYIAIIEDLIPTIEFGKTGWAHLVPDPLTDGYQIILDYEKQLRRVSCPTWAPIIPIEEVEFTVWGQMGDRRGIWKGKEVDIFYGYDDENMWCLNRVMYAYRRVDGLDFTYELYGHLADRDGQIVGIVSEAAWGRPLIPSDKALVASELKRLESFGCVYTFGGENHLLIADGKLRLAQPIAIRTWSDPEDFKIQVNLCHHVLIDQLFQEFEDYGPYGNFRLPPAFLIGLETSVTLLRNPIPRGISVENIALLRHKSRFGFRVDIEFADDLDNGSHDKNLNQPKRFLHLRRRKGLITSNIDYTKPRRIQMAPENDDDPLASSSRLRHRVFISIRHPYARSTSSKILKTLPQEDGYPSDNNSNMRGAKLVSHQRLMIAPD